MTQSPSEMTSMERVLTTLGHREPDRVPLFLLLASRGAQELDLSIEDYFAQSATMVEGQLRIRAKYRNDCYYAFSYAALEVQAWGGDVIFVEDGPPNAGPPMIRRPEDIPNLVPPSIEECPCLVRVLTTIEELKVRGAGEVPIIGVVMSPFSLPVMQMGFDNYLDLIYGNRPLFDQLMKVNEEFCVAWASAQLKAGATAICYFDPVSSQTIVPRELYLETGFPIARRTLARIPGPTATHFASGRCLPIINEVAQTGTAVVGVSAEEDLGQLKGACRGRLTLLGNLNGLTMRHWTPGEAESIVKRAIAKGGTGGGFILSDNHGEIPCQTSQEVLLAISEAVHTWGRYPLNWLDSV